MIVLPSITVKAKIYESANSFVYRGIRKQDNQAVILKVLKEDYPTKSELTRYKQEYEITRSLNNIEGVIKAERLQEYQRILVIILEDFGGKSLEKLISESGGGYRPMPLLEFLRLAIKITDILGNIHAANVIHKDINPGNIVLNPETGIVKIIDFGISTRLPRSNPTLKNTNVLEGTLAYISPEQTGRMNRSLDYRTDFYGLGATFYELLTNKLPFQTTDAIELVHCHIAKQPISPYEVNLKIPQVVSGIIMKLLAKNAEERYQSAWGIKADLEECLAQSQRSGTINEFPLANKDISDKFQIPQKLYGREREIQTLLTAFERVAASGTGGAEEAGGEGNIISQSKIKNPKPNIEMMLIAGCSGIGKSALLQEISKLTTEKCGYFIWGKLNQFKDNIPYSAVVTAFQELVRQLITETETQLKQWREKLLAVLGANGQVIIDIIPEVELIIGKQPSVPKVGQNESENRFNRVFKNFIRVFCREEHPLVIFLDDLQWVDSSTLKLIELMLMDTDTQYLFLIGAYRDNEVNPTHSLMMMVEWLRKEGAKISQITLAPLELEPITQLIAETLHSDTTSVKPLAELVVRKTLGNPFFVNEFLKTLYAENLITFKLPNNSVFEFELNNLRSPIPNHKWSWDLVQIEARDITDNVVELIIGKLKKLPNSLQQILQLAACIGANFNLSTLSIICRKKRTDIFEKLVLAIHLGLILPISDLDKELLVENYKFSHDKVQQAVYSLIDEFKKKAVHLQIGHILLETTSINTLPNNLFCIVDHFNFGVVETPSFASGHISQQERNKIARLNLMAGQKAKTATAYGAAKRYLTTGIKLLAPDSWQLDYDLTLALYEEAAEAAYLCGHFDEMERWVTVVLQQAKTLLDKIKAYEVKIQTNMAQTKLLEAVKIGLQVLELLGVSLPESPTALDIQKVRSETTASLTGKNIEDLSNLPVMTDAKKLAAMRILLSIAISTYVVAPALFPLLVCEQVNLSIKQGNAPESAFAYAFYGVILNGVAPDIESAYQFGKLALNLVERFKANSIKSKTFVVVAVGIIHGKYHIRETFSLLQEAYFSGIENGDLDWAGIAAVNKCQHSYFSGMELTELEREIATYSNALAQLKQQTVLNYNQISRQAVLNLLGQVENPCRLQGVAYDEEKLLPLLQQANDRTGLHLFYLSKLILCYLFGEFSQAVENAASDEPYLDGITGRFSVFYFYDSLAQLAVYASVPNLEQEYLLFKVTHNQKKLLKWATSAPMNFQHKYDLVEAEKARVLDQVFEAEEFYEQAIKGARDNGYIQEEALAYELAAKFYLVRGREKFAQTYMKEAYYCYVRWGAIAKVKDLEVRYPQLLIQPHKKVTRTTNPTITTSNNLGEAFDLATVMKASVAISGEIVLDKLLSSLMKILIENAGAQTGLLILDKAGEWVIEVSREVYSNADREASSTRILQSNSIYKDFPLSVINYVARTHKNVVLNNASYEGNFTNDHYIKEHRTKSILCAPLVNQRNLVGIVYLENNLAIGAFTRNRVEVLQLLSGQAAIAITNAKLYAERQQAEKLLADYNQTLEQQVAERTLELSQEKELLQAIIDYIPVMITLYDPKGRVQFVNQELEQFLGWSSRDIEEIDLLAEFCLDLEQCEQVLEHMIAATGKWLDFKVRTQDNRYVDTSWANIRLSNGMIIGIGQDISARKLAEEASILEERNRLARDIHDTLAQDFVIIALHLDTALRKMTADVEAALACIQAGRERTRSGLAEARRSVSALRSPLLEGSDLYSALNRLATQMFSQTNTYTVCEIVGEAYVLPKDVENNLFRIGQEALNNAFKYAKASKIRVKLVYESRQCVLRIKDNGQGFEVGSVPVGSGFGLPGMTERAEHIGAKLTVWSAPGQGTEVVVVLNQRYGV